jgi:hypothetical protein
MADEQHPMDRVNDLVNLAYTYQQDGAFFTAAAKLREAADLMEQHIRQCYMDEAGLTTHEVEVLRILNGEDVPGWVAGAAMNECCSALKGKGYAAGTYHITDQGRDFLKVMNYAQS